MKTYLLRDGDPLPERMKEVRDEIERRAYEMFLARAEGDGNDLCDWCEAEKTVLTPGPLDVAERDGQVVVRTVAPGFSEQDLEIGVDERHVVVHGIKDGREILRETTLHDKVVPECVTARFQDGVLEVDLPKAA